MINKLHTILSGSLGLFSNRRKAIITVCNVCNEQTVKINELIAKINELETKMKNKI